ncbi:uracil DNA glycosylase [Tulasnella sp. 403]|nr:uracil DNA glycosylase [Tulasnella sp. 403]
MATSSKAVKKAAELASEVTQTDADTVVETEVVVEATSTTTQTTAEEMATESSKKRPQPEADEDDDATKRRKPSGSLLSYFKVKQGGKIPSDSATEVEETASEAASSSSAVKDAISDLETRTLALDWRKALQAEFSKDYFLKLKAFVQQEFKTQTVYPVAKDVYSWSRLTPLASVKVIVIGQDPYHGPNQAHGLSFSVREGVALPPSLRNIYKQIAEDYPKSFTIPKTGDLTPIARQGVLWLNTSLTVRKGQAASHSKKGWETFTTAVLKAVLNRKTEHGVVFLAWGAHAQKICKDIGIDQKKHLVLKSAHPSPLSAHNGFFGNGHFKKTNEWLKKNYGIESMIDWSVLSKPNKD